MKTRLFRLPRIYDADGKLAKRWFVYFYFWNYDTRQMERKRVYADLHTYHNKKERLKAARLLKRSIKELLLGGWSPFGPLPETMQEVAKQPERVVEAPKTISIKKALDIAYKERCMGAGKKTISQYSGYYKLLQTYIAQHKLQDKPITSFTQVDAKDFMAELKEKLANTTYNKYLQFFRSIFEVVIDNGILKENPFAKLKKLKATSESFLPYNAQQVEELSKRFEKDDPQLYVFTRFLFYAFIRPNELRQLQVKHVDLSRKVIHIPKGISKTHARYVEICKPLAELIESTGLMSREPSSLLISKQPTNDKQLATNEMSSRHREILEKLGYPQEYKLYAWKHSGVIAAYSSGLDIITIQHMCGHTTVDMTNRYLSKIGSVRSAQAVEASW